MKRNKKNIHKDLENFLDYSGNQMTGEERNIFEKDLQKDPFESDAAEGLSSISHDEAMADMNDLNTRLAHRTRHSRLIILYRIAAGIAAILVIGTLIIFLNSDLTRIFERTAVTESKETAQPVIFEEPLTESEVETRDAPVITDKKTAVQKPAQDVELTSEPAEDKKLQTTREITDQIEISEEVYHIEEMDHTVEAEIETIPAGKAAKSETVDAGRIITRKYVDNYVRGVVISSEDQLPLPGATVKIRGTSAGTYTDQNGNFELPIMPDTGITLVAEYIGMEQNEVNLDHSDHVEIALIPAESSLDEVVVIGYGVQKKSNISGAVSTMNMDDDRDYQLPSPVIGNRKFKEYIEENLQYPAGEITSERAVVVLNFIVTESGRPKSFSVLKSPGKLFTEEAIRLMISGPDWIPAKRNNEIIEEETMIRIVFKPQY